MHHIADREFEVVVTRTTPYAYVDCCPSIHWLVRWKRPFEGGPFLAVVIYMHPIRGSHAIHNGNEVVVVSGSAQGYLNSRDALEAVVAAGTAATTSQS
jgi:hypothetical protein